MCFWSKSLGDCTNSCWNPEKLKTFCAKHRSAYKMHENESHRLDTAKKKALAEKWHCLTTILYVSGIAAKCFKKSKYTDGVELVEMFGKTQDKEKELWGHAERIVQRGYIFCTKERLKSFQAKTELFCRTKVGNALINELKPPSYLLAWKCLEMQVVADIESWTTYSVDCPGPEWKKV